MPERSQRARAQVTVDEALEALTCGGLPTGTIPLRGHVGRFLALLPVKGRTWQQRVGGQELARRLGVPRPARQRDRLARQIAARLARTGGACDT